MGAYHNTITTVEERVVANFLAAYKVNNWFSVNFTVGANNAGTFRDQIIDELSQGVGNGLGRIIKENFRQLELQSTLLGVFTPKIGKDFLETVYLNSAVLYQKRIYFFNLELKKMLDILRAGFFRVLFGHHSYQKT